jgi:hypothetical protein
MNEAQAYFRDLSEAENKNTFLRCSFHIEKILDDDAMEHKQEALTKRLQKLAKMMKIKVVVE